MGINVNMDYSTLFSSMSGASSTSSGNYLSNLTGMLSDYSSIQNGSYGKLVSAYYKKMNSDDTSKASSTDKEKDTKSTESTTKEAEKKQYTAMAKTAKELQSDAEKLMDTSDKSSAYAKTWQNITDEEGNTTKVYDYDANKAISAVSNFVKDYNSLISSASDAKDTTTSTRASYMSKITKSYKSELGSIGISVGDDGKLSIDKDKMKEAGVESIKNVMGGKSGYSYQISSAASLLESSATHASSSASTYSSKGSYNSDLSSILDSFV